MSLTISINGTNVSFLEKSPKFSGKVNQRSTCSFTVFDNAGTALYKKGQPVVMQDTTLGIIFEGFVDKAKATNYYPQAANKWQISCKDMTWIADKRYSNSLYANQYAGTIICDQVQHILSKDGVWGNFALDYNHQLTDWTPTENYSTDTFTRANQSGLGTASDGETWALVGSGTMTAAISSNEGTLTGAASSDTLYQLGSQSHADVEAVIRFKATDMTKDMLGPALRIQSATNWYRPRLYQGNLTLGKMISGTFSTISQVTFTTTNLTYYWMRYRIAGQFHFLRAWQDGMTEPASWQVIAQDASITAAGGYGVEGWSSSSTDTISFDHLTVQAAGLTTATTNNGDGNPSDGDLELAPAGLETSHTDSTTSQFNAGTLTSMNGANNQLQLASWSGLQMAGTANPGYGATTKTTNLYSYWEIWNGSYTIASGDALVYSVWINSSSPAIMSAVDGVCSDGTNFKDFTSGGNPLWDQNNLPCTPKTDLSGFANDQWYTRTIDLSPLAGKSLSYLRLAFEGDSKGLYTSYFHDILIQNGGTTKLTAYSGSGYSPTGTPTAPQVIIQNMNNGYSDVTITPVYVYAQTGTYTSAANSAAGAGIYQSSQVFWDVQQTTIVNGVSVTTSDAGNSPPANTTITVNTSWDGGVTFQNVAKENDAIGNIVAGASLSSISIETQVIFAITGKDPTVSPVITNITWTIWPSYACVKTDILAGYSTQTQWNTGTYSNTQYGAAMLQNIGYVSGIYPLGNTRTWDDASLANQTLWGTGTPVQDVLTKQCILFCDNNSEVRSQLNFAGQWQNFIAQVDIQVPAAGGNAGMVYRTTNWNNNNNTFAYTAYLQQTTTLSQIVLGYGSNSGSSGSFTQIGIATLPSQLALNDMHTLKVIVNGSQHSVYLDDVLYVNVSDSTYSSSGYIGLRMYNTTGGRWTEAFDNFGKIVTNGVYVPGTYSGPTWTSPSMSLGSMTVGQSLIQWNDTALSTGDFLSVLASVNGGAYTACTNGQPIPGLSAGTILSSATLSIQIEMQGSSAIDIPVMQGLSVYVMPQFSASGVWISPSLSLAGITNAATSLVNWNDNLPNGNTSVAVQTSIDNGSTWQNITTAGNPISNITLQPAPVADTFTSNDSGSYTQTELASGGAASWTWDTANSRLTVTQTTGVDGVLEYPGLSGADMTVMGDFSKSDSGGLVARLIDSQHCYFCSIADGSAASNPNTVKLYKFLPGSSTTLLTTYFSNTASSTLSTANKLYSTSGSPTTTSTVQALGAATGYGEVYSQGTGSAWPALGSIGSPSGHGFLWDVTTLENQSIVAGSWGATVKLQTAGTGSGTITADIHVRAYKRSAGGTYTQIIDMLLASQSITTSGTNFTLSGSTSSPTFFSSGDKLYIDVWLDVTANGHASTQNLKLDSLSADSSGQTGSANEEASTPGYQPTVSGTATLLGSASISFNRNTYHRFILSAIGTTIVVSMDGTQLVSVTDSSVSGSGNAGILAGVNNGNTLTCYQFRVQPVGENVSSLAVLTKITLTSTDPLNSPQLLDSATLVADPTIGPGVLVPSAQYQGTYVGTNFDDLNKKSNYWWTITGAKQLIFQAQNATVAPWIVQSSDATNTNILVSGFGFEESGDLYCNQVVLLNVNATLTQPQLFAGDGTSTSWKLAYPVAANTIPTVTLNDVVQTVGIKGTDTGKQFYYQVGSTSIDEDASGPTLQDTDELLVTSTGSYLTTLELNNTGSFPGTVSQSQYASIDSTSGIVTRIVDCSQDQALVNMDVAAATVYGNGLLQRYGVIGRTITGKTLNSGLAIGQQTGVFVPAFQVNNAQVLVSQIDLTEQVVMQGGVAVVQYWYSITLIEGPALDSWQTLFNGLFR